MSVTVDKQFSAEEDQLLSALHFLPPFLVKTSKTSKCIFAS